MDSEDVKVSLEKSNLSMVHMSAGVGTLPLQTYPYSGLLTVEINCLDEFKWVPISSKVSFEKSSLTIVQ